MSKNRTHTVTPKKADNNVIRISKEFLLKSERAARREVAIETGTYRQSGSGTHGGTNRQNNRRDRKQAKQACRRGYDD
ncbi:MAG: hypothetical protein K2X27_08405 [Candidatus Obscuribacterales bacterium]|nr:hypothetical protein [Candidatus Obscuribacterales bacterium]